MPDWERKAYTDAVLCLMDQPSQLDPVLYPAAINRFLDYAVVHVNRTSQVHIGKLPTTILYTVTNDGLQTGTS